MCLCPALLLAVREEKNQWALSAPEDQRQPPIARPTSLTQAPAHSLLVTSQKAYSSESRAEQLKMQPCIFVFHLCLENSNTDTLRCDSNWVLW